MRVALVHDFLDRKGGAERVLRELVKLYPDAPIYTLLYDANVVREWFPHSRVIGSRLQRLPGFLRRRRQLLLLFFAVAIEQFDLSAFDLVISSSGAWSKGVITRTSTVHVCYCHSPMRFAWDWYHNYIREHGWGKLAKFFIYPAMNYVRVWDKVSASRVDHWIANSTIVRDRIEKFYRVSAVPVVYPPVSLPAEPTIAPGTEKYFLMVTRLSRYKNVELVARVCQKMGLSLRVVGGGPDLHRLKQYATSSISFLGDISDQELVNHYAGARALINASEEDFGIVPVEAMMLGKPVIALKKGGVLETVTPESGLFFDDPSDSSLEAAITDFIEKESSFNSEIIKQHAQKFSAERFDREIKDYISQLFE